MIKAHILRILAGCPAKGIAVPFLRTELGLRMGRKCGDAELSEALTDLKTRGSVADGGVSLSDDPMVKLTTKGRGEAANL